MIMAVLATMAWQGIDGIVRARDISQAQVDRSLRLNTVIAQWDQDLAALIDTGVVPALRFDGATLRLSRQADGGVQMVAWSLREQQWQRWAGPVVTASAELQDSWMRSQQLLGNEPGIAGAAGRGERRAGGVLPRQQLEQCAVQRRSAAGQPRAARRSASSRRPACAWCWSSASSG